MTEYVTVINTDPVVQTAFALGLGLYVDIDPTGENKELSIVLDSISVKKNILIYSFLVSNPLLQDTCHEKYWIYPLELRRGGDSGAPGYDCAVKRVVSVYDKVENKERPVWEKTRMNFFYYCSDASPEKFMAAAPYTHEVLKLDAAGDTHVYKLGVILKIHRSKKPTLEESKMVDVDSLYAGLIESVYKVFPNAREEKLRIYLEGKSTV